MARPSSRSRGLLWFGNVDTCRSDKPSSTCSLSGSSGSTRSSGSTGSGSCGSVDSATQASSARRTASSTLTNGVRSAINTLQKLQRSPHCCSIHAYRQAGSKRALPRFVANHYKELIVWQLADALRQEVYQLI